MIRLLLAAAIWIAIVGGLLLFTGAEGPEPGAASRLPREPAPPPDVGGIVLELTGSFEIAPDRFQRETPEPALLVRVNGEEILRASETLPAGRPVVVERKLTIRDGPNELFVMATPGLDAADRSHALRVRLLSAGRTLIERTAWNEPGQRLVAVFPFELEGSAVREPDRAP